MQLNVICNDWSPTCLKVLSSCLLQYKPIRATNLEKLGRRLIKITSSLVFLVQLFLGMCDVIPVYVSFVCVVMRYWVNMKLFIFASLCFKNLILRHYAYVLCNVSLNTPVTCSFVCFPGMMSSLAKLNKSLGVHFLALFLKFPSFLMLLNIQIDLLILKTYYGQFTLTTKKSLHIIFKA